MAVAGSLDGGSHEGGGEDGYEAKSEHPDMSLSPSSCVIVHSRSSLASLR
jgi:hypothetical protein